MSCLAKLRAMEYHHKLNLEIAIKEHKELLASKEDHKLTLEAASRHYREVMLRRHDHEAHG